MIPSDRSAYGAFRFQLIELIRAEALTPAAVAPLLREAREQFGHLPGVDMVLEARLLEDAGDDWLRADQLVKLHLPARAGAPVAPYFPFALPPAPG